jgi:hypothetical protein
VVALDPRLDPRLCLPACARQPQRSALTTGEVKATARCGGRVTGSRAAAVPKRTAQPYPARCEPKRRASAPYRTYQLRQLHQSLHRFQTASDDPALAVGCRAISVEPVVTWLPRLLLCWKMVADRPLPNWPTLASYNGLSDFKLEKKRKKDNRIQREKLGQLLSVGG